MSATTIEVTFSLSIISVLGALRSVRNQAIQMADVTYEFADEAMSTIASYGYAIMKYICNFLSANLKRFGNAVNNFVYNSNPIYIKEGYAFSTNGLLTIAIVGLFAAIILH